LAYLEVVQGDASFCEVFVKGGKLLEQLGLVDLVASGAARRLPARSRLVLSARQAVVHLRLGPILLGLVAL